MKKRRGVRKSGVGHPRGKKPKPPADVDQSAVMTAQEVAGYLNCHKATVFKLVRRGKIPGLRLGGEWRFLKSKLDKWIAEGGSVR
jgi:excisionase family DNA binding protein